MYSCHTGLNYTNWYALDVPQNMDIRCFSVHLGPYRRLFVDDTDQFIYLCVCCRQYVWLQLLWYLVYHCVMVMELRCVNTYYNMQLSSLNHGYPGGGFFVWCFLKSACPLDGTGGSGQSPRAFWTWSHVLWLKVGNSVISLRICVCLWHPWHKVRWIMCN